jgi:hypothetical protein
MNRHNAPGFVSFVSLPDGTSPREESSYAYWLERLKRRKAVARPAVLQNESAISSTDKTDKTPSTDADIGWRVKVMRAQIPTSGPIPFLVALPEEETLFLPGHCGSCGDPLAAGRRLRCAFCQEAAWLALNEVREGVPTRDPT